ncbi:MAG: uroporphyrin-III C-methyltransferase/precorrin-2 dehydrogenase/sirohydrochlorin ferrochelatase [Flavobacteriales bacterium]|jgi:uroporphyrin-III C-methyltransferase/precorrin-2 dehydrogenase/sirohydrochlorin ferrochelatase
MDYLPLFFDLKRRDVLIVGGGAIATRKAKALHKAQACIHVVSLSIEDQLSEMVSASGGSCRLGNYAVDDLDSKVLVVSATDDHVLNSQVSKDCGARNIPVNVVDSPELCSVIMPAIVDRSPLIIAVSSGGESPVLARKLKSILDSTIPSNYGALAKLASRFRDRVKQSFADIEDRRRFWEKALNGVISEKALAGNAKEAEELLEKALSSKDYDVGGEVFLVGAGPGDPDLLTFKALRLMQSAEVVLYDRLVSQPVLDMVRKDAEFIYVGKQRSDHAVPQTTINQMLLEYAQQGKRVLRLKGGDPFIFGRGAEEIDLLAANDIPFQVVPGITAASGCASYAGIPLTHRDYSQSVRFITGHVKDGVLDFRWKEFVEDSQTLVFYMGLTGLPRICEQLIAHGKSPQTPAALIERGTQPGQRVHVGDLESLPELVKEKQVHAPTLLVIGGVVSLHKSLNWYKP